MYTQISESLIVRVEDGAFIPVDASNTDYQAYAAWLAEGNTPLPPPAPSLEHMRADLRAAATAQRWKVEAGGLVLEDGTRLQTGIEDQNRITSVVATARLAGISSVNFKSASGWVTLPLTAVEAIAGAIGRHVQACFYAERVHHEAIAALVSVEQAADYDVNAGWPS